MSTSKSFFLHSETMRFPVSILKMIPKYLMLAFVLLVLDTHSGFSIPTFRDTTEVYNYWSKRMAIEIVDAFIKDYLASGDPNITKNERQLPYLYSQKFLIGMESISSDEMDYRALGVKEFLLQNQADGRIIDVYKKCIENHNYRRPLTNFYNTEPFLIGDGGFVTAKTQEIMTRYNLNMSKFIRVSRLTPEERRMKMFIDSATLFISGMAVGGFFVFLYSRIRIYSILKSEKSEYIKELKKGPRNYLFGYLGLVTILKRRKDLKNKEIDILKAEIRRLRKSPEPS